MHILTENGIYIESEEMNDHMMKSLVCYQKYLLDMLLMFDDFCKENGIAYFLAGGSTLGAVRHQGFIPWDDDIDLAMMRPDFERMEQLFAKQNNKLSEYRYSPVAAQIIPDAPIGHLLYLPQGDYPQSAAPKLDIHPIDGVPDGKMGRLLQRIFVIVHYLSVYRHPTKNKGRVAHEISKIIVKITPDRLFNWYARVSKKIITAKKTETADKVCSLFGLAGYQREIMDKNILLPYKRVPFCGYMLPIPNQVQPYLTQLYGNYNDLPPEEERHPKHSGYLQFVRAIQRENGDRL